MRNINHRSIRITAAASLSVGLLCAGLLTGCGSKDTDQQETSRLETSSVPSTAEESSAEELSFEATSEPVPEPETIGAFSTCDVNGNPVTEEIFANSELTMVNIFATWCGPCINEIPHLAELDKEYDPEEFQIVGIILDVNETGEINQERLELALTLAELTGAEYPFIMPDVNLYLSVLMDVYSIPETFFVDKNGVIVGDSYVGSRDKEQWQAIIEKELSNVRSTSAETPVNAEASAAESAESQSNAADSAKSTPDAADSAKPTPDAADSAKPTATEKESLQ